MECTIRHCEKERFQLLHSRSFPKPGLSALRPLDRRQAKKILQFDIYNCCGTNRFKAPKEISADDTSCLVKLQGGNWIYYNEPKDSIAFFIKDSLDFYWITHFKANGDSIGYFSPKKATPCPREYKCSS